MLVASNWSRMERNLGLQMVKEMYPLMQAYYVYFGDLFILWLFYHFIACLTQKKKKLWEGQWMKTTLKSEWCNKRMYYKQKWQSKKIKDPSQPL